MNRHTIVYPEESIRNHTGLAKIAGIESPADKALNSVVSITCWEKRLEPVHRIGITHSNDQYYPFKWSVIPIQMIGNTHSNDQ